MLHAAWTFLRRGNSRAALSERRSFRRDYSVALRIPALKALTQIFRRLRRTSYVGWSALVNYFV